MLGSVCFLPIISKFEVDDVAGIKFVQKRLVLSKGCEFWRGSSLSRSLFNISQLRDIFRIDINTGCNTHDLIGCNCDGTRGDFESVPIRKTSPGSGKPLQRGFMSASSVSIEDTAIDQEVSLMTCTTILRPTNVSSLSQYLEKKKAELASLSEWKHINCLKTTAADEVKDDVLRVILHDCGPKPKSFSSIQGDSKMSRLLEAVDINNIGALDKVLSVTDVPGGTVSFLFEKGGSPDTQDAEASSEDTEPDV